MYGSVYCREGRYYFPMYYTRLTTVDEHLLELWKIDEK